ncbi:MAG: hypothetical protein JJE50_00070 [Actinomycetales bacterium]|nr:hypothetical protein [Actinomycetales bacterium]
MGNAIAGQLVRRAHAELDQIGSVSDERTAFLHAHMAALRAAAAVLALTPAVASRTRRRRRAVLSVWEQLAEAGPQWESWADFFAAGAPIRAAIDSDREVDLDRDRLGSTLATATDFVALVTERVALQDAPAPGSLAALAS